jgi:hypothetical protein
MHYSQCLSFKRFFSSAGKSWGYDPYLLAGFPRQTLANADNKGWEVLFFLLSPILGAGLAFKFFVLSFLLTYPFMIYAAARNFKLPHETSLIAAGMAILYFHSSLAIDFVFNGMASYSFVCYFSIYYFSLFYKLLDCFSWKNYIVAALVGSFLLLMHILSTFTAAVPILILYICCRKKLAFKQHLLVLCLPVIALILNSYWIMPVFEFLNDKTTRASNWEFAFQIKNIFEPIWVYFFQQKSFYSRAIMVEGFNCTFMDAFLLLLGCLGFRLWYKKRRYALIFSFAGIFLLFFGVTYYGSHTSFLSQFQPERFSIPLNLYLIIPASIGIYFIFEKLFRNKNSSAIVFIVCLSFVLLYRPFVWPYLKIFQNNLFRISCTVPENFKKLTAFLDENTSREGRILIEDSEFTGNSQEHVYGGHFPALLPDYVKREYLCGPRPFYPIKHSYASFSNGLLFERDINTYSSEELKELLKQYNVKWIVCWMQPSKDVFNQQPGFLKKIAEIDRFTIYEVVGNYGFFLKGQGQVFADYNRIELKDLVAEDNGVVISYHWMKQFKTEPPITLEKAIVGDDPVGFIKLIDPPKELVIYNAY